MIPKNFNPKIYLELNPDLVCSGVDPFQHYLEFGVDEGRLYSSPQLMECGKINPKFETILVVSHEASLTGAPVLTYNIVRILSKKYNVVLLLLGGGILIPEFLKSGVFHIECINQRLCSQEKIESVLENIANKFKIKFAILNSVECSSVVEFLAKKFIGILTLIHEFTSYTRPLDNMGRVLFWSTELIFSSKLIYENACLYFPDILNRSIHILAQGKCAIPDSKIMKSSKLEDIEKFNSIFNTENTYSKKKIILGVGSVHIRKGVDHFIECANIISSLPKFNDWRFVWIGKGYDPDLDGNYSIFLKDQIERSGLSDRVIILGETDEIMKVYRQSDILVIPSRLDPLPNVSIDAISLGMPLVCYKKATGIADIFIEEGLEDFCVADYMNTQNMCEKIIKIIDSDEIRAEISSKFKILNNKYFNMEKYISEVNTIALTAAEKAKKNKSDCKVISKSNLFEPNLGAFVHLENSSIENQVISYVNAWSTGLGPPRKGIRGFHPGIYSEKIGVNLSGHNPLAHYISAGMPKGPWNYFVISSASEETNNKLPDHKLVAVHIHVYYIEIFYEIIERLSENNIKPDLFITITDESNRVKVSDFLQNYKGNLISIDLVINLGRNIKPFIETFHNKIIEQYKYVAHFHTKKSPYDHPLMGPRWVNSILNNLLGIRGIPMLDLILKLMEDEINEIGIVVPEDPNIVGWNKNLDIAYEILYKLNSMNKLQENFIFPIGAMFVAKCKALQYIVNPKILKLEYPKEPVQRDGTVLHAIERLIGYPMPKFKIATAYLEGTKR